MAKQVKVFAGSVSIPATYYNGQQTTTFYTVPSGRVAKIHLTLFQHSGTGLQGQLIVGGYGWYSSGGRFPSASSSSNFDVGLNSNSEQLPRQFYLAAGQSLQFTSSSNTYSNTTMWYQFSAVEEY